VIFAFSRKSKLYKSHIKNEDKQRKNEKTT